MIFEFKNKDYGAYILRKGSDKRHLIAIILASFFFTAAVSTPTILKNLFHKREVIVIYKPRSYKFDNKDENSKKNKMDIKIEVKKEEIQQSIKFIVPKPDNNVLTEDSIVSQKLLNRSLAVISTETHEGKLPDIDTSLLSHKKTIAETEMTYTLDGVEEQPSFPGGNDKINKFLSEKIIYPEYEVENGISGKVYVQFVVGKDGKIVDVDIARGVSSGLDQEALRVTKLMPVWNPGRQNGKAVKVKFNLPIYFRLASH